MSDQPAGPILERSTSGWYRTPVPTALWWGVHLLVAILLLLTALRGALGSSPGWAWVLVSAVVLGTVYALGPLIVEPRESPRATVVWLIALMTAWLALLALSPDAIYLAFAWFFLLLHLLPRTAGLLSVAAVTAAAVAGFAWHQRTFTAAMVIGPGLGAAVAVVTVFGYQTLQAESEQRRRLIVELDRTRSDLAAAEHQAGVLNERERLAREIHDTLAQGFSSIQLLLRAATRSLDPEREIDPVRAGNLIEQARLEAQENLAEARLLVQALSPADLAHANLTGALERLGETTSSRTGIRVSFHAVGPPPILATAVEVALLRIAQAALANVTQHARATRADVTLTSMETAVTLDVLDDGAGFDPRVLPETDNGGFGLRSMKSRAAELGGVLTVESQPGGGTAISVSFDRSEGPPR